MNDNDAPHYVSSPFFRRVFEERAIRDEISAREYYLKEGREEGSVSTAIRIATRMLKKGEDLKTILEYTELDIGALNALRASMA